MRASAVQKSTNVRSIPPDWIRLGMRGLEACWPPLATHLAERLLLTPIRHRTPSRERGLLDSAHLLRLPWWPDGQTLVGYRWGEGPPILLVHGWAGRATQLGAFVAPLIEAGHSVLGFDLPAHGRSDGEQASLFDFRDALLEIGRKYGPFAGVIAHSMGAAAATLALASGLAADRLVLIASPASLRDQTKRFARTLGLSDETYGRVTARLETRLRARLDSVEVERIAPRLLLPSLVVHDDDDLEVPIENGVRIAAMLPRARLHRTHGLGHRRVLREPAVLAEVTEFVSGQRPSATSSAPDDWQLVERELFNRDLRPRR